MSVIKEFKAFVMRGNVVDMAVGIIIGAAFTKVVSSFVSNIIMPPLGLMIGGVDFSDLAVILRPARDELEAVTLGYGAFIQSVVDFLIVAAAIFVAIKVMNRMQRKKEEEPAAPEAPPEPTKEELLLTDIRDLLQQQSQQ